MGAVAGLVGVPEPLAVGAEVLVGDDRYPVGAWFERDLARLWNLDRVSAEAIINR